jgi:hypothetical protein
MTLETVPGVIREQGRIYRAAINGHIKPSDMCRYMYGLREIRCSIESLPPEAPVEQAPPIVNIVSVEADYYVTNRTQPDGKNRLTIEHMLNPEPPIEATNNAEVFVSAEDEPPIDVPEHEPSPILAEITEPPSQPYRKTSAGWVPIPPKLMQRPPGR